MTLSQLQAVYTHHPSSYFRSMRCRGQGGNPRVGSMYRGLPGIMKLDPACQELWDGGGVKGGGTLNPRPRDGGVSTQGWAQVATNVSPTSLSTHVLVSLFRKQIGQWEWGRAGLPGAGGTDSQGTEKRFGKSFKINLIPQSRWGPLSSAPQARAHSERAGKWG